MSKMKSQKASEFHDFLQATDTMKRMAPEVSKALARTLNEWKAKLRQNLPGIRRGMTETVQKMIAESESVRFAYRSYRKSLKKERK